MKKLVLFAVAIVLFSCKNQDETISSNIINNPNTASGSVAVDQKMPKVKFEVERIEFGDITQGEKIHKEFTFTNTGEADLIISNIYGSCGCTVPKEWPTHPIKPGEKGSFKVTFDSEGKSGQQTKQITMQANTNPASNVVALAGNVIVPKSKD